MIPIRKLHAEAMNRNAPVQSIDKAFAFRVMGGRSMLSLTTREVMTNAKKQNGKLM